MFIFDQTSIFIYNFSMRSTTKRRLWYWTKILFFIGVGVFFIGSATLAYMVYSVSRELPSGDEIINRQIVESTKIYDRTGTVLLYEVGDDKKRTIIPLSEMPQSLKDATIAIEDQRFYTEPAFDWRGIARAAFINLTRGGIVQGGSTITQQLVKKAFLTDEQTPTRKLKELILAVQISKFYTKDKILELYLNEIPYGPTIYGVESASQAFFGKSAKDLTLAESAILAAIPKAPSRYSPWGSHLPDLIKRQHLVLSEMKSSGKISEQEYAQAIAAPLSFMQRGTGVKAPHFVFMVLDELAEYNEIYGGDFLKQGGLRITTTLDWNLQQAAESAVSKGAERNEKLYKGKNAALVAQDPKTGQILALVGSRDYFDTENDGNFNVASQGLRQPGSTLKPFVYMTAFEKGYTPDSLIFDAPTEFSTNPDCSAVVDFSKDTQSCFHPENFDHVFRGPVPLKKALALSLNVPAVKTLYLAGLRDVITKFQTYGLSTLRDPNQYGLSLVLGGGAVHLTDLVQAYSVLAQEGAKHPQTTILEVKDNKGQIIEHFKENTEIVAQPQYPRVINGILSDSSLRAELFSGSLSLTTIPGYDVALKTGTSNDYRDAWTVGYTPFLVAGVWAGNNNNTPMVRQGSSILAAVPIWNAFMVEAVKQYPAEKFAAAGTLDVPNKPMLNGVYTDGTGAIHDVLHYVDKNDPLGAIPTNPSQDPQYSLWETGVSTWLKEHANVLLGGVTQQLQSTSNP